MASTVHFSNGVSKLGYKKHLFCKLKVNPYEKFGCSHEEQTHGNKRLTVNPIPTRLDHVTLI